MVSFSEILPWFVLELEKIAAKAETRHGWSMSNSRSGRKPMSVDTLLRKEKDSSLGGYKLAQFYNTPLPFSDVTDKGGAQTMARKMPGYIRSRDELSMSPPAKAEDGRNSMLTVFSPSTFVHDVAATNRPSERTGGTE